MRLTTRDILWICWAIVSVSLVVWFIVAPPFKHPLHQELGRAAFWVEPFLMLQPFCALWMVFRAFRDEKNRLPYVAAIALVPLGWLWYYVERVRPRVRNRRQ
jgi:hypothetical protein